jgi:hypothetical protein
VREIVTLRRLLVVALLLRLGVFLALAPHDRLAGGDGPWYVRQGWLILHGGLPAPLTSVGPLYPLALAAAWLLFPGAADPVEPDSIPAAYLTLVRLAQVGLGLGTVWLASGLARRLGGAGLVTAAGLALGPAFVLEPFNVLTESLFLALLTLAVTLYVRSGRGTAPGGLAAAGAAFGLAALARPVVLLLPLLLIPHLVVRHGPPRGARRAALLLAVFVATLAPWLAYLQRSTGHWVPPGGFAQLWLGATPRGEWPGNREADAMRRRFPTHDTDYVGEARRLIFADPGGWILRRTGKLGAALAQPHGTEAVGTGIRGRLVRWRRDDRSLAGLAAIVVTGEFALKLATYASHYAALGLGAVGAWSVWRRGGEAWPVCAPVLYLIAVHWALPVVPRYLFPAEVFLWVLAGAGWPAGATASAPRAR